MLLHLHQRYHHLLEWHPYYTGRCLFDLASKLEAATEGRTRQVWGFIDGTFREICRPSCNQRFYYSGYKKKHGFKYQGIVASDGIICSLIGPFEGKINDANMFHISDTKGRFKKLYRNNQLLFLYGDIAYESKFTVITPYPKKMGLPSRKRRFNKQLSLAQISVEQIFDLVQGLWTANRLSLQLHSLKQPVASWYTISVLLTNIYSCLRKNCVSIRYDIDPPTISQYLYIDEENLDKTDENSA